MKIVPAVLGAALSVCPFGAETPSAYARIAGSVRMADGSAYRGSVHVACGGQLWSRASDGRGRYSVEYAVGIITPEEAFSFSEDGFTLRCRVAAGPGNRPSIAATYADVRFARSRGDRVTTVVDLVEGEIETEPPALP